MAIERMCSWCRFKRATLETVVSHPDPDFFAREYCLDCAINVFGYPEWMTATQPIGGAA